MTVSNEFIEGEEVTAIPNIAPILVKLHSESKTKFTIERLEAPQLSTWTQFDLSGVAAQDGVNMPQQVLAQEDNRRRAVIQITPNPAGLAVGFVYVGKSREQVNNGRGGRMSSGMQIVTEGESEVWIASDGTNPLGVLVLDERYRKDNE